MKKVLAGILATSILSTIAISVSAVDYTVGYDKTVTGGSSSPMVEAPTENGVPYGIFNLESEDTVKIPVKGSIGSFGGGGTGPEQPIPYPTSAISISMPIKLTFGNYSDAKGGSDFTLSQDSNQFYSANYSITNNTIPQAASADGTVAAKTGEIEVSIVGATQTGSDIELVSESSIPETYAAKQMRIGFTVGTGFTGTVIPNEFKLADGTYKNGATVANTASFSGLIKSAAKDKAFVLGKLGAADNTSGNVVGKTGTFKILGDASKVFPTDMIQNDFSVTFKFSNVAAPVTP